MVLWTHSLWVNGLVDTYVERLRFASSDHNSVVACRGHYIVIKRLIDAMRNECLAEWWWLCVKSANATLDWIKACYLCSLWIPILTIWICSMLPKSYLLGCTVYLQKNNHWWRTSNVVAEACWLMLLSCSDRKSVYLEALLKKPPRQISRWVKQHVPLCTLFTNNDWCSRRPNNSAFHSHHIDWSVKWIGYLC